MKKDPRFDTETALGRIWYNIHHNQSYGEHVKNVTYPYFSDSLYVIYKKDEHGYYTGESYIGWSHYGSSANSDTIDALEWVLENIFKLSPKEFEKRYDCKSVYYIGE